MQGMKYVKILVEEIHSTTAATIGEDGRPQTRAIDMMLYDENGVYFLTAKGKAFYQQLMEQQFLALSGTKDKKAVSLRGKIKNIGSEKLDEIFEKNTYMQQIYPGDTRDALEVFCLHEAQGEYFDISDPSHMCARQSSLAMRRKRKTDILSPENVWDANYVIGSVHRNALIFQRNLWKSIRNIVCIVENVLKSVRNVPLLKGKRVFRTHL